MKFLFWGLIMSISIIIFFADKTNCAVKGSQIDLTSMIENSKSNSLSLQKANEILIFDQHIPKIINRNATQDDRSFLKPKVYIEENIPKILFSAGNNSIIPVNKKIPFMEIESIDTQILIKKDKNFGEVSERVKFILQDGIYHSIIRKISLGGTSERHYGFKLASRDVKLTSAKVISNCFESNSIYDHPYVCVIAFFEPIDTTGRYKN
jgi:hypothetical protein